MLIGILADTHGDHLTVRKAIELFNRLGVEHVIHCGDVCGDHVFDELVGKPCTFVWGNMDEPDSGLLAYLKTVGLTPPNSVPTRVTLDGKRFAIFHGHEREFDYARETPDVDYILYGHTHVARDERIGQKRIINPGALYRTRRKTVATLDTASDKLLLHPI